MNNRHETISESDCHERTRCSQSRHRFEPHRLFRSPARIPSLLVRGALLELVTVGFYRFWLRPTCGGICGRDVGRGRRAGVYRHGEELYRLLFALAILVPIYVIDFLVGLEAERARRSPASAHSLLLSLRPIRDLSRAPSTADAHGLAWGALLDGGLRHGLCSGGRLCGSLLVAISLGFALPWRQPRSSASRCATRPTAICPAVSTARGAELFKRGWWL